MRDSPGHVVGIVVLFGFATVIGGTLFRQWHPEARVRARRPGAGSWPPSATGTGHGHTGRRARGNRWA